MDKFMKAAIDEARLGLSEGGIPIGSVLVKNGEIIGRINTGLVVMLGIKRGASEEDARYLLDIIIHLRIFHDSPDKMNLSLMDVKGEMLLISKFTLYVDALKGRRPSYNEVE